ncbi:superinfection immunity protein [Pseudomonas abietaniphila]|uniref:superinfection immunity protein n=1 Tax=Pseudomonas abietaniphila TaxID=89065 RepID=UPI000783128F|nr:superinfection immunity protein [Pseudomonas abietaniphila]
MSNDSGTLGALMLFFIGVVIYFLPTINAKGRKHPNAPAIFLLNLFLGWTLVGWVVALVWSASAISDGSKPSAPSVAAPAIDRYAQLEKIASMKERGLISEEEYQAEKTRLLQN